MSATSRYSLPCPHCGYDIRAAPSGSRCPECGADLDAAVDRETLELRAWMLSLRTAVRLLVVAAGLISAATIAAAIAQFSQPSMVAGFTSCISALAIAIGSVALAVANLGVALAPPRFRQRLHVAVAIIQIVATMLLVPLSCAAAAYPLPLFITGAIAALIPVTLGSAIARLGTTIPPRRLALPIVVACYCALWTITAGLFAARVGFNVTIVPVPVGVPGLILLGVSLVTCLVLQIAALVSVRRDLKDVRRVMRSTSARLS